MGEPLAHGIGDLYTISFFLTEDGSDTTYSDAGTDGDTTNSGGNGIDVLSCASASFNINQVPEPVSVLVLTAG